MEQKYMIEGFAGEGKLAKFFKEAGYEVITIDNNPNLKPDICVDMLNFNINMLPEKFSKPDVIHFGVPCTKFSIAGRSSNFTNFMPNDIDSCVALALVYKSLNIINKLKPKSWFIENPVGYLRKFPFMKELIRRTVWYCQYGDKRAKPTDFFTNRYDWITKKCFNNNPNCHHERAPRGSKTGTQGLNNAFERGTYPDGLCKDIVNLCEGNVKERQNNLL